jgi:hypothetical protein
MLHVICAGHAAYICAFLFGLIGCFGSSSVLTCSVGGISDAVSSAGAHQSHVVR